jgi:hypothetical protein
MYELVPSISEDVKAAAHHEAGHMVAAAVSGLRLDPRGMRVDQMGEGIAFFKPPPDASDESLRNGAVAIFAGFCAQRRFNPACDWHRDDDWQQAHALIGQMQTDAAFRTRDELLRLAESLVDERWAVIEAIAAALLTRDWEPLTVLWTSGVPTAEKYISGGEVVSLLGQHGIVAAGADN